MTTMTEFFGLNEKTQTLLLGIVEAGRTTQPVRLTVPCSKMCDTTDLVTGPNPGGMR
jgi:hypothetical protein